jgi:Tol biopolymer transport system component
MKGDSILQLTDNTWNDEYPVWSPDGKRIAFTADPEGHYDIFVMESDGSRIVRLTTSKADEKEPAWWPDGTSIVYSSEIKKFIRKQLSLWRVDIETTQTERVIPGYNKGHAIPHVSPDGLFLTFTGKRTMGWDAAMYDRGKNKVEFLDDGGKSCRARFSKDGKKLAYVSSKSDGKGDIWTMNPDGTGKMRLTERDDTYDYFPSWSPDGKFVVFNSSRQHDHNGDWALYVVDIKSGEARLLFDSPGNDVFPDWR